MTCLEHLIENTLINFRNGKTTEEIYKGIEKDVNLEYSGISVKQCWTICQYVWCCFIEQELYNKESK